MGLVRKEKKRRLEGGSKRGLYTVPIVSQVQDQASWALRYNSQLVATIYNKGGGKEGLEAIPPPHRLGLWRE